MTSKVKMNNIFNQNTTELMTFMMEDCKKIHLVSFKILGHYILAKSYYKNQKLLKS
jgi:hypothetical protein